MKRYFRLLPLIVASLLVSCINPQVTNLTRGGVYPTAPGANPFVLATLVNDTTATITATLTVDEGRLTPTTYTFDRIDPGTRTTGVLVPWPFLQMTLGDLTNPFTPSIDVTLPGGLTASVPFGQAPLQAGEDVFRGDAVLFEFLADVRSPSAITVQVARVPAESQTGPFTQADTFTTARLLLLQNGLGGLTGGNPGGLTP